MAARKMSHSETAGRSFGRARDLLSSSFDTADCVLACYSAAGFADDLKSGKDPRLALVALEDIYRTAR